MMLESVTEYRLSIPFFLSLFKPELDSVQTGHVLFYKGFFNT